MAAFLVMAAYYYWQCAREDGSWHVWNIFQDAPWATGAYGDLADAFRGHSVSLLIEPDPKLTRAVNPYDPASRLPGTALNWDYSYYHGKYYLYFGPVPVLLVYLPWHFLFGYDPTENLVMFLFCLGHLLWFAGFLRLLVRNYFGRVPLGFEVSIFVFYGLASLLPFMASRPMMYDLAIASSALFTLGFFGLLLLSLQLGSGRWRALLLAGCAAGLAAGSRPTTIFLFVLLYVFVVVLHWRRPMSIQGLVELVAIGLPTLLSVYLLCWYNYARFHDIFTFGNRYQLNYGEIYLNPNFGLRNIPGGIWAYYLTPWHVTAEFPYVGLGSDVMPPLLSVPDRVRESYTGLLVASPLGGLSVLWWFYARKLESAGRQAIMVFGTFVSVWAIFCAALLSSFFALITRYEVELQLPILILTALALLARRHLRAYAGWEWILFGLLLGVSCYVGFSFGLIGENNWLQNYLHPGS